MTELTNFWQNAGSMFVGQSTCPTTYSVYYCPIIWIEADGDPIYASLMLLRFRCPCRQIQGQPIFDALELIVGKSVSKSQQSEITTTPTPRFYTPMKCVFPNVTQLSYNSSPRINPERSRKSSYTNLDEQAQFVDIHFCEWMLNCPSCGGYNLDFIKPIWLCAQLSVSISTLQLSQ